MDRVYYIIEHARKGLDGKLYWEVERDQYDEGCPVRTFDTVEYAMRYMKDFVESKRVWDEYPYYDATRIIQVTETRKVL